MKYENCRIPKHAVILPSEITFSDVIDSQQKREYPNTQNHTLQFATVHMYHKI